MKVVGVGVAVEVVSQFPPLLPANVLVAGTVATLACVNDVVLFNTPLLESLGAVNVATTGTTSSLVTHSTDRIRQWAVSVIDG